MSKDRANGHLDINLQNCLLQNKIGLHSLQDDHKNILNNLSQKISQRAPSDSDGNIKERINAVNESLQLLEIGLAENEAILTLAQHFDKLETEKCIAKLEMKRVKDENDWLREELEDTEKRLHEALLRLTELEEEKKDKEIFQEVFNINL